MKTDANGFRRIVLAVGGKPFLGDSIDWPVYVPLMYEKLGMDSMVVPDMEFVDPYVILKQHAKYNDLDEYEFRKKISSGPWSLDDYPMLEDWVNESGPFLDLFADACMCETFDVPLLRLHENQPIFSLVNRPHDVQRDMGNALAARARYRLGQGDIDGAINDRIACAALGRHLERFAVSVHWLRGTAVGSISNSIAICAPPERIPNVAQLDRLKDGLARLPKHVPAEEVLEYERYMGLDMIQNDFLRGKSLSAFGKSLLDKNAAMRRYNSDFDRWIETGELPKTTIISAARNLLCAQTRSMFFADSYAYLLIGEDNKLMQQVEDRIRCQDRISNIVIAMYLYHAEHGTFPPAFSLDDDGRPMHSWRVLILPQLGLDELYGRIRIEEPWDSEFNSQFHEAEIPFYRCDSFRPPLGPGQSSYSVVLGKKSIFDNTGRGKSITECGRESRDMILVTERLTPGCWMRPEGELTVDEILDPAVLGDLGSHHNGINNAGTLGISTKHLRKKATREELRAMLIIDEPLEQF